MAAKTAARDTAAEIDYLHPDHQAPTLLQAERRLAERARDESPEQQ